ncbi:MAG: GGDEF domain-containing protein, partial [Actinobacteria bacterium]|nr:GGDEF domain-containing protein [Actinomycetota bacterium]
WGHTVARLSGDEFAVLIDPARDRSEAIGVAEAIRSALAEPVDMADSSSVVGVSIGLAFDPAGAASADVLIDEADRMLRKCKSGGKNCIEVVDLSD